MNSSLSERHRMYILGIFFVIFVNFSLFSCTPPEQESSLVNSPIVIAITTVTHSSPSYARHFNSLLEEDQTPVTATHIFRKEKISTHTKSDSEETINKTRKEETLLIQKLIEEEKTAIYYDSPSARSVGIRIISFVYAQICNDSVYP